MSNAASGATVSRLFDPDRNIHYALSEDAELELRMLFRAMDAFAIVADTPPGETGAEINPSHIAPLLFTFARHGQRIMADARARHPHKRKPA